MSLLIWIGTAITLAGLAGLVWVIRKASSLKDAGLTDAEIKARLERLTAPNLAALAIAAIGLMCVVLGIVLS